MATGRRLYYNLQYGNLGASLADEAGPSTITFGVAPGFATLASGEYIPIIINNVEVVHLISYTAGATTGTIERGQEGTTPAAHGLEAWWHGPTMEDFNTHRHQVWDGEKYVLADSHRTFIGPINPEMLGIVLGNGDIWEETNL